MIPHPSKLVPGSATLDPLLSAEFLNFLHEVAHKYHSTRHNDIVKCVCVRACARIRVK